MIAFFRLVAGLLLVASVQAAPHEPLNSSTALDKQISTTLSLIADGDLAQARVLARQMAWRFPDFALGQLISAELESTAAFGNILTHGADPMSQPLMALLLEAQARLSSGQPDNKRLTDAQEQSVLPDSVIQLGSHNSQLILVDLQASTLSQITTNNRIPSLIRQHYIGSGKAGFGKQIEGDNKTPLGIYAITGLRSDASLPDLYGSGALMLDYPNALDRYLGRTGSGIWLHGVPHAQRSRSPRSSEGCVTMSNDHLLRLKQQIVPSDALVVLGQNFQWSDQAARQSRQREFQQLFTRYQQGWTEANHEALMALYHDAEQLDQRVDSTGAYSVSVTDGSSASQRYIKELANVAVEDVTLVLNPLQQGLFVTETEPYLLMQTRFGRLNEHQITLFWRQQSDGRWRIVTEQWDGLDV